MQTLSIEILNPKAISILNDLADLELISFRKKEKKSLKKILLTGPTWTENEEKESLKARKSINKIGNAFT
jgi:hypothetical protein